MNRQNKLSESQENCLRAIYELERTKKVARVKDIAEKLEISNSSVSQLLRQLNEKGMTRYEPYAIPVLSEAGKAAALSLSRKYHLVEDLFKIGLGVESGEAREAACCLEHVLSPNLTKNVEILYRTITGETQVRELLRKKLAAGQQILSF
jgi:DtxR family transcriptional regulator, Mn-dependent transcriptional regulator